MHSLASNRSKLILNLDMDVLALVLFVYDLRHPVPIAVAAPAARGVALPGECAP